MKVERDLLWLVRERKKRRKIPMKKVRWVPFIAKFSTSLVYISRMIPI